MAGASKLNTSHRSRSLSLLPNDSFFFPQPLLSSLSFLISLFCLYSLMCFCLCLVVHWLWSGDCGQEAQWWFSDCSHEARWWCGSDLVGFTGWFGGLQWWLWSGGSWVWFGGLVLVGLGCLYRRCLGDGDDESWWCYWWVSGMVVVDGLLRSGRGNGATVEVFLFCFFFFLAGAGLLGCWVWLLGRWCCGFFFATMVCGCGRWWFKLRSWDWWLVLSFEAPTMEVVGLIQRWRDQVERREREGERLKA